MIHVVDTLTCGRIFYGPPNPGYSINSPRLSVGAGKVPCSWVPCHRSGFLLMLIVLFYLGGGVTRCWGNDEKDGGELCGGERGKRMEKREAKMTVYLPLPSFFFLSSRPTPHAPLSAISPLAQQAKHNHAHWWLMPPNALHNSQPSTSKSHAPILKHQYRPGSASHYRKIDRGLRPITFRGS
jgi:hypothetical protein